MGLAIYKQPGKTITYTNPSAVAEIPYKTIIDLDTRVGIAAETIAAGGSGSVEVEGVYEFPAINTAAFDQGQELYWDAVAEKITNDGTDNTPAGWAFAAKLQAGTTVSVKLKG